MQMKVLPFDINLIVLMAAKKLIPSSSHESRSNTHSHTHAENPGENLRANNFSYPGNTVHVSSFPGKFYDLRIHRHNTGY